ncbi:unnamed protein product [Rotaria sp. Silwood2]|nr:unnamed protein product [Rotaria sp. Silwood2]
MDLIENLSEIKEDILQRLQHLKNVPKRLENPNIYHLDIGAMYPNIILTNRLQPSAIVDSTRCAQCDLNRPNARCQRKMDWIWRGTYIPATRNELQHIQLQLENERFSFNGQSIQKKIISNNNAVLFHELPQETQLSIERKRLADYCRKAYKKTNAAKKDDLNEAKRYNNLIVIYDSLQLAHKCILNSFYGYVMRKGYFKMCSLASNGMGGIVCTTGSTIIKRTRELIEQIGRPLELDTDGIWCVLPATSPENYELIIRDPSRPKVVISYPCSLLNLIIKDHYTNDQYHEPYLAMILPASKEEGKRIKKRYCVFNMDGTIAELKDFEVKCNGELQLIKIFQASVFEAFLKGTTLEEYYNHVATIADYWLDMLYSHAKDISDKELFELISERRTMSRMLSDYGEQKSTSISTAKRLAEFLGEDVIKDKGLCCRFVIANVPCDAPVTERTIPFQYHVLYKQKRITDVFNSIDKQTHIDNNEQQLILTNDIEDIGQQTESSIKLIKKTTTKTLKRKREDLNDKTTTRQWRIVLGPPPSFGQTTNQHIKWLSYQKRKWEIQHEQRHQPSIISDKIQLSTKQKTSADGKIDTYIRRAAEHLHTRPWQIISYELTGQIGIFKACCLVKHELVQIKIKVPRIFYVNYRTSIENNNNNTHEQLKQTQRSSGYERTINNCSKHVNRLLLRYIMTDLSNPNIEGVYEMNVPLDFRLLVTLGFEKNSLYKQKRITDVFNSIDKQTHIDNNEQRLILTNDIEDIGQQTESSIKLIKKTKTLKRKRDDLNDKTITRQWRIVLGPPPSFGQTTNQHIKWLNYQKRKWEIQHEQRHQPTIISDKIPLSTKQKTSSDGKIDTYIRRAAEHLHTRPWQIISYELTDQIGIFKAWCLVEHELVQIKIKVPRIFYVNYRTSIENNNNNTHEQLKQTQRSSGYERTINNCSKRVNRLLPRCSQAYYLYEYRLDENHFHDYYTDIMTDLSNPNIEGVYEMNVPLDFRLLVTLGCICSLRKEQYRTNILSNLYQYDELEFLSLSEQTYLQAGTLQCIYLYIHQDNGKLFIALFIPNNCRVFIGILDSIRENHMPNLNKLLKNECEKRLQKGIDTNLLPINEHQFEVKVDMDIENIWKRFNKIISNRK